MLQQPRAREQCAMFHAKSTKIPNNEAWSFIPCCSYTHGDGAGGSPAPRGASWHFARLRGNHSSAIAAARHTFVFNMFQRTLQSKLLQYKKVIQTASARLTTIGVVSVDGCADGVVHDGCDAPLHRNREKARIPLLSLVAASAIESPAPCLRSRLRRPSVPPVSLDRPPPSAKRKGPLPLWAKCTRRTAR